MPLNEEKFIAKFNVVGYFRALDKELKQVTYRLQQKMVDEAKANLASIPFKHNAVRIRGSKSHTTDAARKQDVISSVVAHEMSQMEDSIQYMYQRSLSKLPYYVKADFGNMGANVSALRKGDYSRSHIGIYYEYGTGENASPDGPIHLAMKYWNPERPKHARSPIVSRSREYGDWVDMGGNPRYTTSHEGGRRNEKFIRNVGEDLHAHYWFRKAFHAVCKQAGKEYAAAFKKVSPFKYIKMNKKVTLGKKWSM